MPQKKFFSPKPTPLLPFPGPPPPRKAAVSQAGSRVVTSSKEHTHILRTHTYKLCPPSPLEKRSVLAGPVPKPAGARRQFVPTLLLPPGLTHAWEGRGPPATEIARGLRLEPVTYMLVGEGNYRMNQWCAHERARPVSRPSSAIRGRGWDRSIPDTGADA